MSPSSQPTDRPTTLAPPPTNIVARETVGMLEQVVAFQGLDASQIFAGLEELTHAPSPRVSWDAYCVALDRIAAALPEGLDLRSVARSVIEVLATDSRTRRLISLVASPGALLTLALRWGGPRNYPHLLSTEKVLAEDWRHYRGEIPSHYRGSLPFFQLSAGIFEEFPRLIGLPPARIEDLVCTDHSMEFRLRLPQSRTIFARIVRAVRRRLDVDAALEEMQNQRDELSQNLLELQSAHAELSMHRLRLENLVRERTAELESTHRRLVEVARFAGMSEVAVGVLHNLGNALNSVAVSAELSRAQLAATPLGQLQQVLELLELPAASPDGRQAKVIELSRHLAHVAHHENLEVLEEIDRTASGIARIADFVRLQHEYVRPDRLIESTTTGALVREALATCDLARPLRPGEIVVQGASDDDMATCELERHRLVPILVSLFDNARDAVHTRRAEPHEHESPIEVTVALVPSPVPAESSAPATSPPRTLRIAVRDRGVGIAQADLVRIFGHGFTTKPDGRGFALHDASTTIAAMGGTLQASSDGPGQGATFTIELPVAASDDRSRSAGAHDSVVAA